MPILNNTYSALEKSSKLRHFDTGRIYMAIVKDTRTPVRGGEIRVFILNSGPSREKYENDERYWVTASYAPRFFGVSGTNNSSSDSFYGSPTSFGESFPIPLINNYVFVFSPCISGENVSWYWFACPMDNKQNYMIPGIPYNYENAKYSDDKGEGKAPLCEINKNDENYSTMQSSVQTITAKENHQPVYQPLFNAVKKQGLQNDKLRGFSTSSFKRSSPSMSYGYLTPLGNQFTIDDGWSLSDNTTNWVDNPNDKTKEKLIMDSSSSKDFTKLDWTSDLSAENLDNKLTRYDGGYRFRTRNGTQLLISDSGNIYTINKDGTAWTELTDDGYIDCYSSKGVNVSSGGDINLKTTSNINIECGGNLNMKVGGVLLCETTGKVDVTTPEVNANTKITCPTIHANEIETSSLHSVSAHISGAVLQGTLNGTAFYATYSGVVPVQQPVPIAVAPVLPEVKTPTVNSIVGQGDSMQDTITSRSPTFEPYKGHDKNDFIPDLKVNFNAGKETKKINENSGKTNTI